jgi:putative ABC transport system substrate-binding protein
MRRRDFITLFAGGMLAAPLPLRAQSPAMPVVGFISPGAPAAFRPFLAAFHEGLNKAGYHEGRNITIEYRWAEGDYQRLQQQATELVQRGVTLILATGGQRSATTARAATSTIPIVFLIGTNPVHDGLVASLNRPGGNATGVSLYTTELVRKRLAIVRDLLPKATTIGLLVRPLTVAAEVEVEDLQRAAAEISVGASETKLQLVVLKAITESDVDAAFASAVQQRVDALIVGADSFFTTNRAHLIQLAARHRLPTAYPWREYAAGGGLMSYGPNIADAYRQVGDHAARILKGAQPADLPVQLPTKFDLILNLKTAKALGLEVPWPLLSTADETIE